MRVVIQHKKNPTTGKGLFVDRLIPALKRLGVEVTGDTGAKADIALHVGRVHYKSRAKKNIIRCGPASIDTNKNHKAINKAKWKSVKQCDGVIYQSKYSQTVYHHLVGKPKVSETIIFNGADPKIIKLHKAAQSPYSVNFLACTRRWWPQKRLKWIIRAFNQAAVPDSRLWICGDVSMTKWAKGAHSGSLHFEGVVGQQRLARLRKLCCAHLHIVYADACPNSVVESLVFGLPVICGDTGGTHELVRATNGGFVFEDKPFKYRPIDMNKVPGIDVDVLAGYMKRIVDDCPPVFNPYEVQIGNIAKQYVSFFKDVLNGS